MLRDMLKERRISPETRRGDFLDQISIDMEKEKFLSEDFSVQLVFGGLFATFESISAIIALAFSLLAEHPSVVEELTAEHEAILKNRENPNSSLTWDEYKSMTFTLQVINEILRLGNVAPGLLRRALKDIPVKGFTIPEGWTIMVVTSALQLSPNTFKDPLEFNPWRWKDLDSYAVSKNFMPFGGGMRQCAGAEYSRVFLATFLHVLVTKYRYGPIFRTSLVGRPLVVSADPEFNSYLFQQEGKLVELGFFDSFTKILKVSGDISTAGSTVHKYLRSITLNHFGAETLKGKLLPLIEKTVVKTLASWSSQASVEVKHASSVMLSNFGANHMIGYDAETSSDNLSDKYSSIINSVLSVPLNVPGTAYHNGLKVVFKMVCLSKHAKFVSIIQSDTIKIFKALVPIQDRDTIVTMLRDTLKKRRMSPDTHRGDFLDQISSDIDKEKFLSEESVVYAVLGILFASFEPMSSTMALAFCLLAEHPAALKELTAENEALLKNRENPNSSLTWDEYKSMTFTRQVVDETLRLANISPGLLRRAVKDIPVKGFTIPAGWTILALTSAFQLSPNTFKDPLEFNPWRWKDLDSLVISKNFMPFGRGSRQCAGAEYSRVFLATFFHVLVTKYNWKAIKAGRIARNTMLGFGASIHIKLSEKKN
ncbi:unnamed protein product [Prunus brigantina]